MLTSPGFFLKEAKLSVTKQALVFTCLQDKSFENTVVKGEITRKNHFKSLFQEIRHISTNCVDIFSMFILPQTKFGG